MGRNSRPLRIPPEFDDFIGNLSEQIARDTGMLKNKTQTMRMLAKTFKGKILWKGNKFDIKLF